MKIVQINAECGRGSTGRIAVLLSELLTERHIENYVFYSGNHKSGYERGIRINSKFDLRVHQVLSRLFGDQGWHSRLATARLVRRLKKLRPDCVHLHNLHGYYLNLPLLFRYLAGSGCQVVWTFHDCWPITGHCAYFTAANCERWKRECCDCPNRREYPYSLFFDRSGELLRRKKELYGRLEKLTVVTPSLWLADIVRQSFLKDCRIELIPNGIDLSVFKPTESALRQKHHCESKFVILGVASVWDHRKGLDVFCELAGRLGAAYQIILVGTTQEIDRALPETIISVHRTQDQTELAMYYTMADVFLNPTRQDNFPSVNLEALACGTPVVTFETGGSPEAVDESCGSAVPCDDVDALEAELRRVCEKRPYTAEACCERARAFERKERFEDYIRLYKMVTENG